MLIEVAGGGASARPARQRCGLEFDYASESILPATTRWLPETHARPADAAGVRWPTFHRCRFCRRTRLDSAARSTSNSAKGRAAEVLRSLCNQVLQAEAGEEKWATHFRWIEICSDRSRATALCRGTRQIVMAYRTRAGHAWTSSSCRGQQRTLSSLAHMTVNPGSVLLLDRRAGYAKRWGAVRNPGWRTRWPRRSIRWRRAHDIFRQATSPLRPDLKGERRGSSVRCSAHGFKELGLQIDAEDRQSPPARSYVPTGADRSEIREARRHRGCHAHGTRRG